MSVLHLPEWLSWTILGLVALFFCGTPILRLLEALDRARLQRVINRYLRQRGGKTGE